MNCNHILLKGIRKGQYCNKPVVNNTKFCQIHQKLYQKIPNDINIEIKNSLDKLKNICKIINSSGQNNAIKLSDNDANPNQFDDAPLNDKWKFRHSGTKYIQVEGINRLFIKLNEYITFNKKKFLVPQIINNRWLLEKKIGSGGFGSIFVCIDRFDPKVKKVIKIEHFKSTCAAREKEILISLQDTTYVPKIYGSGIYDKLSYIVMEMLQEFKFQVRKIPEIIHILGVIAERGWSHGDVKFANIMSRSNNETVIIDFGLARPVGYVNKHSLGGTIMFMSLNAHYGKSCYSNDLESFLYSILNIIFELSWDYKYIDYRSYQGMDEVIDLKEEFHDKILSGQTNIASFSKRLSRFANEVIYTASGCTKPDYFTLENIFSNASNNI